MEKSDFNLVEGEPIYFELDELGRSNGAIAILSKYTIPLVIKKDLTYPDSYGWTKSLENKKIYRKISKKVDLLEKILYNFIKRSLQIFKKIVK